MATIDLTLESFQVPALAEYTPPVGTKKAEGGLSTREVNDNIMMPWLKQRPVEITENSTTKASADAKAPVQSDCNFVFTAGQSVSFTLDDADYIGCRATFHNTSAYTQTVNLLNKTDPNSPSYDTLTVLEGGRIVLVWNGTAWQNISPVDTVADGNMNPVTSNAVADAFRFTTVTISEDNTTDDTEFVAQHSGFVSVYKYYGTDSQFHSVVVMDASNNILAQTGGSGVDYNSLFVIFPINKGSTYKVGARKTTSSTKTTYLARVYYFGD